MTFCSESGNTNLCATEATHKIWPSSLWSDEYEANQNCPQVAFKCTTVSSEKLLSSVGRTSDWISEEKQVIIEWILYMDTCGPMVWVRGQIHFLIWMLSAALPLSASSRSARLLRSSHSLEFPCSSSSLRLSSFLCFVIPIWNGLLPLLWVALQSRRFVLHFVHFSPQIGSVSA